MSDPTDELFNAEWAFYCAALGNVASQWNHMQEAIGTVFCTVADTGRGVGFAIWYSTQSDRAQREMLRAAIPVSKDTLWEGLPATAKSDLISLLDRADSLADQRNDAIHAPVALGLVNGEFEVAPFEYYGHPRAKKLVGKEILDQFEWYGACASTLAQQARAINSAFAKLVPWPGKLHMPSLTHSKNHKK